jgi:hypothetical protein
VPSRELKRRYDCRISGRPITTSRLPQLSVAPRIPARSINGHDRNGRACCGMRRSTSRVLSRLPPLFGARVGSMSVRRDLPAASDDTVRTSVERRNVDRVHDLRIVVGSIDIRRKKDPGIRPELRLPRPHLKCEQSRWPEFVWNFRKCARTFKGIFCADISEFESYMPSHAVVSR